MEAGRDTSKPIPATLASLLAGIDWNKTGKQNQGKIVLKVIEDGFFTQPDRHLPRLSQVGNNLEYLIGGYVFNLNALRCKDLTDGMMLGRRIAKKYEEFYRKYVPGCENIELVVTASLMGIRESRRIVGEYELTFEDYLSRR